MAKKKPVTNDLQDKERLDIIRSKEVAQKMKRRTVSKWVAVILCIALFITGTAWGVLSLVDLNSMKITINKESQGSIALSPDESFEMPSTNITVKGPSRMEAVTYPDMDIDNEVINVVGTDNSPAKYIAYSVYLKNFSSTRDITYATHLTIPKSHKNFDSAIRVLVIVEKDGVSKAKLYAKAKEDGTPEFVAYDSDNLETQRPKTASELNYGKQKFLLDTNQTIPFKGKRVEDTADENYYIDFTADQPLKVGEYVKYTVALWVEGTDADCKDEILGGFCTVRLEFGISSSEIDPDQTLPKA